MLITDTKLVEIFCEVDDFCKEFDQHLLTNSPDKTTGPDPVMSISEMITIEIRYHLSGSKCFNPHYALENLLRLKTASKSDAMLHFLISP